MPVVINEFEVLNEPSSMQTGPSVPPEQKPTDPIAQGEIERTIRKQEERLLRVRAH